MPYLKTNRKNKPVGEKKPFISRRNKDATAINNVLDKMMWEAILRDEKATTRRDQESV